MEQDREKVLELLSSFRADYEDYFVPIGTVDKSTEGKKEVSGLANMFAENLPVVKAIVENLKDYPVYVGYDGRDPDSRSATYVKNLVLLHATAEEAPGDFVWSYAHELIHADQDMRGLLRDEDAPKGQEDLVPFLVHNLALEAAAFATEAITIHYTSYHSGLLEIDPSVEDFFGEYLDRGGRDLVPYYIAESLPDDKDELDFEDYKQAWERLFMSFFDPDSKFMDNYMVSFCADFLERMEKAKAEDNAAGEKKDLEDFDLSAAFNEQSWGSAQQIKEITTIPAMGQMFGDAAMVPILHMIQAAVTQNRFQTTLDVTRRQAEKNMTRDALAVRAFKNLMGQQP